jgi:tetratricopeptide (TPR) repeat protein
MGIRRTAHLALALVLSVASATVALADQVTDQAKRLLQERKAKEAYDLLMPLQSKRAGEVEYDYLLGVAALDAGDAQQAVFALERVLAVDPNYLQARAEIARAYFVLGEKENARREFRTVRESRQLPEEARATVDRFLSALEPQRTLLRGYLEATVGYDTNVNSATGRTTVALPALGGIIGTLDPFGTRQSDGFWGLAGGASLSHAISNEWWALGSIAYAGKYNFEEDRFDTGTLDGSVGARWSRGDNAVIALAQGQRFEVDNNGYRNSVGGTAQWLHNLTPTQQLTLFGQYAALRYPTQAPRDANRTIGGVAYSQAVQAAFSPVWFASGYAGEEKERDSNFPYLGHKPAGLRLGGQVSFTPAAVGFASMGYEYRRYNGTDPFFLTTRRDQQLDVILGLNYGFAPQWTLRPQFAYTRNFSNIDITDYDRTVTSVSVRRDF